MGYSVDPLVNHAAYFDMTVSSPGSQTLGRGASSLTANRIIAFF
jgi:hypothetical protein